MTGPTILVKYHDRQPRFTAVALMGPEGISPPAILDRRSGAVSPMVRDEWIETAGGLWMPAIRGGAYTSYHAPHAHMGSEEIAAANPVMSAVP